MWYGVRSAVALAPLARAVPTDRETDSHAMRWRALINGLGRNMTRNQNEHINREGFTLCVMHAVTGDRGVCTTDLIGTRNKEGPARCYAKKLHEETVTKPLNRY